MKTKAIIPVLVCLLICFIYTDVLGEETETYPGAIYNNNHALGVSAGATSGIGLSYRYWPGNSGLQLTFLPVIGANDGWISFGASYLNVLKKHRFASLYLSTGFHIIHDYGSYEYWDWDPVTGNSSLIYTEEYNDTYLSVGIGPGVEFHLWEVAGFNFMVGYGVYDLLGIYGINTNFTGEIGFYYWF